MLLEKVNRENLLILAEYLESLSPRYKHFDMSSFAYGSHGDGDDDVVDAALNPKAFFSSCDTAACAVGHAPAAGFEMKPSELKSMDWVKYSHRVFGLKGPKYEEAWNFLFGGAWDQVDNHPYGAAARIRFFLDHPEKVMDEDWDYDHEGKAMYRKYRKPLKAPKSTSPFAAILEIAIPEPVRKELMDA
jgi:hypothetical protein